jgi:hypothetical protein
VCVGLRRRRCPHSGLDAPIASVPSPPPPPPPPPLPVRAMAEDRAAATSSEPVRECSPYVLGTPLGPERSAGHAGRVARFVALRNAQNCSLSAASCSSLRSLRRRAGNDRPRTRHSGDRPHVAESVVRNGRFVSVRTLWSIVTGRVTTRRSLARKLLVRSHDFSAARWCPAPSTIRSHSADLRTGYL